MSRFKKKIPYETDGDYAFFKRFQSDEFPQTYGYDMHGILCFKGLKDKISKL